MRPKLLGGSKKPSPTGWRRRASSGEGLAVADKAPQPLPLSRVPREMIAKSFTGLSDVGLQPGRHAFDSRNSKTTVVKIVVNTCMQGRMRKNMKKAKRLVMYLLNCQCSSMNYA